MSGRKMVIFTLLINGVVPWGLYIWLSNDLGDMTALIIATLVPLADNLIHFIHHRKLDAFGSLMLFSLLLTLALVMMGGSEKILLVRESIVTSAIGVVFLGSLLFRRPLMYYLAMKFIGNNEFPANWNYKYFRFVMRLMTLVWGLALTMEAAVRITLVYTLTTAQYLAVSSIILYGFIGAAILWTVTYRRHSAAKFNQMKAGA